MKKVKNVLLLAMSILPKNAEQKENYYQYQNEDGEDVVFPAISQLEPITRMLNSRLGKKGEKLDKIIILETEKTVIASDDKPSAVDFYKQRIALSAQEEEKQYVDIPIDENVPAEGIREATDIILQENEKCVKGNDKMKLWIDTQGGFRDVVMVFTAIISLLREQGIEAEGIYSIHFWPGSTKENPCPIIDQTKKYDIFKFVSAMQEFMDFGKATGFKKYYGEETSFVKAIEKIADAIQICQPQMFENALRGFAAYLKSNQDKIGDPYLQIFIEFIKKDYGILLEKPDDTIEQIKWCVRKEFYQQAMTIYTEKIPKYYYEQGILPLELDIEKKSGYGKNLYADAFYTKFFDTMRTKTDKLFEDILSALLCGQKDLNKNAQKYLRAEAEKTENGIVSGALLRLMENLKCKYDKDGNLLKKQSGQEALTVQGYIKDICNDKNKCNELLYEYSLKGAVIKKVFAIKAAKETEPKSAKLMEYYLAIKLLRNRMNHASDADSGEDEKAAIAYFKEDGIDIGVEIVQDEPRLDYQKIKKTIIDGLSCFD